MNLNNFDERWRRDHPHDNYLPPYLGGPVDEIFLRGESSNDLRPTIPEMFMARHRLVHSTPRGVPPHKKHPGAGPFRNPRNPIILRAADVVGLWVRVGNIPDHMFHIIYYFFTRMGTLETMRAFNERIFYVRYKHPRDTLRALSFHRRRIIFMEHLVCLTCDLLNQTDIDKIYGKRKPVSEEDSNADPDKYDPYCTERFVYADEYEKEYNERFNTDAFGDHGHWCSDEDNNDEFYDGDEYHYANEEDFWNVGAPDNCQAGNWLSTVWGWAKFQIGSLITYLTYDLRY